MVKVRILNGKNLIISTKYFITFTHQKYIYNGTLEVVSRNQQRKVFK